jgi:hypothetical protein
LQLALDAPDLVNTVAVLEPFIASVVMGSSLMFAGMMAKVGSMYATGDRAGAVEVFALAVASRLESWPEQGERVGRWFGLDDAADALLTLDERRATGKVLLTP